MREKLLKIIKEKNTVPMKLSKPEEKLLNLIKEKPGKDAFGIPVSLRRYLVTLEKKNQTEYKNNGWYVKS